MLTIAAAGLLLAACGRGADEQALDTRGGARPEATIVEGCLTAANGQFVLTQLRSTETAKDSTTETYQLVNADDQLRPYVGRQVRVSGEAEAPAVATLREPVPNAADPVGTGGGSEVLTQESSRIEIARMRVIDVTPTGDECAAETQVR
jgi:hypothetical protein